jgi:hypothetical protein
MRKRDDSMSAGILHQVCSLISDSAEERLRKWSFQSIGKTVKAQVNLYGPETDYQASCAFKEKPETQAK